MKEEQKMNKKAYTAPVVIGSMIEMEQGIAAGSGKPRVEPTDREGNIYREWSIGEDQTMNGKW